MNERIKQIKDAIENGTYNWDEAIETTTEKIILLDELDMF